jgi:hypothetical protein
MPIQMDEPVKPKTAENLPCAVCGKVFQNEYNLQMHMGVHKRKGEA